MSATSSASSPAGGGLVVAGLTKRFGSLEVLRGVDLEVREGTTTAILGPSGCGKTTMLRLVAGFDRPDAGSITLAGRTLHDGRTSLPPEDRHVGYVAQEGALFPHLSVEANVLFGVRRSRRRAGMAEELLELVGLEPGHARRLPHQLSGGQQQRVALARALAPDPALVLLDEPFSSLDASLRASTRQAVADVLAARGATAVLVTHDQDEALSMADQVAVVRHGVLAQVADPVTLYRTPADVETAAFVGAGNFLPATVEGGQARCELGGFPAPGRSDGPALVLVRPEQVLVHGSGRGEGPAATVVGSTFHGGEVVLRLELASGTALVAHVPGWARPEVGDVVGLGVAGPAHVLPG